MHDLVIRGGLIVDGSGGEEREGDLAIDGGVISEVGGVLGGGRDEIAAKGRIVTPGFVDVHTHYDGQVTWDPYLQPSTFHGVTTAVMGNCGVGFAPCAPERRDWLISLMEGVEDIPGTALAEGIRWRWETFPEFMDAVAASPLAIDVGVQLPHAPLRAYVMGDRAARLEPATADDTARMAQLAAEAVAAGALGFSTSRTYKHRDSRGNHTPSFKAEREELLGIARAIGDTGKGVLQLIADFFDFETEFPMVRGMVEVSGRPLSLTIEQDDRHPEIWRKVLGGIEAAAASGLPMRGQVPARATSVLMGLEATLNPFLFHTTWREIAGLPLAEKVAALRDPALRRRLCEERVDIDPSTLPGFLVSSFHKMFALTDPPDYEPDPRDSVAARAEREGRNPREVVVDMLLRDDGRGLIYFPLMNYLEGDLEFVREMLTHENTAFGLGDAGAHCGVLCDASFPTTWLTHWVRDRRRGPRLPLGWVVRKLSRDGAALVGMRDRGLLAPGWKADVNVIDFDRLRLRAPEMVRDLPAGGRRFVQRADGYVASIVAGRVAFREGHPTGELNGTLVRS